MQEVEKRRHFLYNFIVTLIIGGAIMKKAVYIGILAVAIAISFAVGMMVGNANSNNDHSARRKDMVGVYTTDSWNGATGTLVLYKDGTCQYPSGGNATWVLQEGSVLITVESSGTVADSSIKSITVLLGDPLSDAEAKAVVSSIARLDNVESARYVGGSQRLCEVTLREAEPNRKTLDAILGMDGVKIVELDPNTVIETSQYEAKIMESGLVLHGHFFEKVSS